MSKLTAENDLPIQSSHLILIAILLIGLIVGTIIGTQFISPLLKAEDPEKLKAREISLNLCHQELNCYLKKCPQEVIDSCSSK